MAFSFCSFSSGSSGNCYLIQSDSTALLVDAGISRRRIHEGMEKTGTPLEKLAALLITHEHGDHIRSLKSLSVKGKLDVYANENTWNEIKAEVLPDNKKIFITGEPFFIGDILVQPFNVHHDATDPVGYSFIHLDRQISIVTDTGHITEEILAEIADADLLILEANHDVDMLKIGRYPWFLKQRVLGNQGHLSNEAAGIAILQILERKTKDRHVLLAHLSKENNFPQMAYQTVKNILEEGDYYIGRHVEVSTIIRDEISFMYHL
jgi:phosphoribosyl 1,2-cyclic phosphodiesterase